MFFIQITLYYTLELKVECRKSFKTLIGLFLGILVI